MQILTTGKADVNIEEPTTEAEIPVVVANRIVGIGIDFGTTYSSAAACHRGYTSSHPVVELIHNPRFHKEHTVASKVFVESKSLAVTAGINADACVIKGKEGVLYELFKSKLGTEWEDATAGIPLSSVELTRHVYEELNTYVKAYARQHTSSQSNYRYVFTYPGGWKLPKRNALSDAIKLAGISSFSLLEEPIAAALGAAYGLGDQETGLDIIGGGQKCILICDLGGGTLEIGVVSVNPAGGLRVEHAAYSDLGLGMANLDKFITLLGLHKAQLGSPAITRALATPHVRAEELDPLWERLGEETGLEHHILADLRRWAETVKIFICNNWDNMSSWPVTLPDSLGEGLNIYLTKAEIESAMLRMSIIIEQDVNAFLNELEVDSDITRESIGHVLITGGGSALPNIQSKLHDIFPHANIPKLPTKLAQELVQRGAALYAYNDQLVTDRKSNTTYGITAFQRVTKDVADRTDPQRIRHYEDGRYLLLTYQPFLRKNELLGGPAVEEPFAPARDGLQKMRIQVREGEDENPMLNPVVAEARIELPPNFNHTDRLMCRFWLGVDGKFHIGVRDPNGLDLGEIDFDVVPLPFSQPFEEIEDEDL